MFKQLSEQDAAFLYLETAETPQHVGSVSFVELPPGYAGDFYEDYKRHVASRVHLNPLMYEKLVPLPFDIDHPFWTEDDELDIGYHVRHQTLPRPGRLSQLEELVGRLHSNFLDRSRPLWEFYVIDGLESGQVVIYTKIHHAAMDGASSQALLTTLYDPTPEPREYPPPQHPLGGKTQPGLEEVLRGMASHFARQEIRHLQYVPEVLKAWAHLALPDAQTLQYGKAAPPPLMTPKTLFNVGITSQRAYAARTLQLSRVKRLGKQVEAKVNDVVLAIVAGALRRYLKDRDALPKLSMTAMVPVSMHVPGEQTQSNQNAALVCTLATDEVDPYKRLLVIRDAMNDQKRWFSNVKNALLPDLSFVGGGALVRGIVDLYRRAKIADRLPPLYNLVVSNVPGPPMPLYIGRARVLSFHPCSIPFHGTALNITTESYCDSLDFGLIACRRTVPDLAELADHLAEALTDLEQAVARKGVAPTPAARRPARPSKGEARAPVTKKAKAAITPPGALRAPKSRASTPSTAQARTRRTRHAASIPNGESKRTS
jgi:diacylglycerol O-acyltransferase